MDAANGENSSPNLNTEHANGCRKPYLTISLNPKQSFPGEDGGEDSDFDNLAEELFTGFEQGDPRLMYYSICVLYIVWVVRPGSNLVGRVFILHYQAEADSAKRVARLAQVANNAFRKNGHLSSSL